MIDAYCRLVGLSEDLERLRALRDAGTLTEEEFVKLSLEAARVRQPEPTPVDQTVETGTASPDRTVVNPKKPETTRRLNRIIAACVATGLAILVIVAIVATRSLSGSTDKTSEPVGVGFDFHCYEVLGLIGTVTNNESSVAYVKVTWDPLYGGTGSGVARQTFGAPPPIYVEIPAEGSRRISVTSDEWAPIGQLVEALATIDDCRPAIDWSEDPAGFGTIDWSEQTAKWTSG